MKVLVLRTHLSFGEISNTFYSVLNWEKKNPSWKDIERREARTIIKENNLVKVFTSEDGSIFADSEETFKQYYNSLRPKAIKTLYFKNGKPKKRIYNHKEFVAFKRYNRYLYVYERS